MPANASSQYGSSSSDKKTAIMTWMEQEQVRDAARSKKERQLPDAVPTSA